MRQEEKARHGLHATRVCVVVGDSIRALARNTCRSALYSYGHYCFRHDGMQQQQQQQQRGVLWVILPIMACTVVVYTLYAEG